MKPMTVTRPVAAPPERVFAVLVDLDGAPGRIRGIKRIEKLVDGPTRVGTRWKETRVMFGREATEEMRVTALEPPRRMELDAESCGCRYTSAFELAPEGGGTRLTFRFHAQPVSLAAKLMSPLAGLMSGTMRRCIEQDVEDIARAAEQ
jgi:carbon monoxide dehydrogenase subunit G